MILVDTHAHLDEHSFSTDLGDVLRRAEEAGVVRILSIGISAQTSEAAVELAERYPSVLSVVGIQPNYVSQAALHDWDRILELATHDQVVGIGETGLDRYWDYAPIEDQIEYFDRHLDLSREIGKPFVVHCRDAEADVVSQLERAAAAGPLNGVMHSFAGDIPTVEQCVELGMHISFAGMLTYRKNEALRAAAKLVPLDRLMVETDAPYLLPSPLREAKSKGKGKSKGGTGHKRNEPAHVVHTARCLAEVHDMSLEELAAVTTENACRLFGISLDSGS